MIRLYITDSGRSALRNGLLFLITILTGNASASAQGNLLITPNRIVFDGPQRIQELNLANTGQDTARYLISFMEIRMREDGTFDQITSPDTGQFFASPYLKLFPRSVTLAPGEGQVVKIQISRTAQLAPGEYRSHIYFRAAAPSVPLGSEQKKPDSSISVRLTPLFGITVPVIIRTGSPEAAVTLSDVKLLDGTQRKPVVSFYFHRSGAASVYGDVMVDHISKKGTVTQVASLKGVAVYTPTRSRKIQVSLQDADYGSGKLRIRYVQQVTKPGAAPEAIAVTEIDLP